jgi:branched-chain amino acid transport system permease protein
MQYVALALHGVTLGSVYALVALGFHLVYRAAGVLDFAQGDKVVLGGLVALTLVHRQLGVGLVAVLVVVGGLLAGVVYDRGVIAPTLRRGPEAAVIATVGALLVLGSGHILVWGATGQAFPPLVKGSVEIGSARVQTQEFVIWGAVALAVAAVVAFLTRTRDGQGMVAAATDPMAAGTVGIDVRQTRLVAFSLAFALAGLAGVLVAPLTLAGGTIGPSLTLRAFTAAVLGGLDSTWGVVVGALLLGLFEDLVGSQVPYAYLDPLVYSVLIVVLLVFPGGIFGVRRMTV